MVFSSLIVLRPFCCFVFLACLVLLLPILVFPFWVIKVQEVEKEVKLISHDAREVMQSEIENTAQSLHSLNSSATNLARILSATLDGTELNYSQIQTKVAPVLFQTLSTIPHLLQISYIDLNGLFLSYYTDNDQVFAVYSNSSFDVYLRARTLYTWYTQPANSDTGELFGQAFKTPPSVTINASWFQEALNSTVGYASLGNRWNDDQDLLFLHTAGVDGRGALSLGFSVKPFIDFLSGLNLLGGSLYLATKDGNVLAEGIPNTQMVLVGNSVSFQLLKPNDDDQKGLGLIGNVTCGLTEESSRAVILNIWGKRYQFYCSSIQLVGVQSVYVLALPLKEPEFLVHKKIDFARVLLVLMILGVLIIIGTSVFLIARAARREMFLCSALIKQMEATQQAERKSMNKSLAFASASHDVRASLACISGLIDICLGEVAPDSELETNLKQMDSCTNDLFGILNSILDTSKIEAGKLQLEEEEFDLAQLLEDVVDLYHPVGMKKGVDILLDPCDGSVTKFSRVRGDRGKLKQILCNLLSNAVKFTSEGHVSVRAWAKKPSNENSILASNRRDSLGCFSCMFFKNNKRYNELEVMNTVQQDPKCMEFIFEVDDTGKGIPKEKQKSVFENYVQVKQTDLGEGGTGLGLGIVQSLVRLMGGEIAIVDKDIGVKGTCFNFNAFLTTCDPGLISIAREESLESRGTESYQHSGSIIHTHSPKPEGSQVVLLIQSDERQRILQKFMESLGIKVHAVNHLEPLSFILKKIKQNLTLPNSSSSGRSDVNSRNDYLSRPASRNSSTRLRDVPLSNLDGTDYMPPLHRRIALRSTSSTIVIVIDTSAGHFREISRAVAEFRKDLSSSICCRVVWIHKLGNRNAHFQGLDEDKLPQMDMIISQPFHGSRLYQVIGLLPEFGGIIPKGENTYQVQKVPLQSSYYEARRTNLRSEPRLPSAGNPQIQTPSDKEKAIGAGNKKPFTISGKKVLVAEDNAVLRKVAMFILSQLGATVEACENGEKAVEIVCKALRHPSKDTLPPDYILMDCQMPVMDGLEATMRIREEEKHYGVYIPIIALTAHTTAEEANLKQAGIDDYLSKPLRTENLLEVIKRIHNQ